ncbi:hypothetical protein [Sulfurimonas sp.]|nr:hypothetical protein [Sulfurimonas sp.]
MKHAYLTKSAVEDALVHHIITKQEAKTLEKKLSICQERLHKH